MKKITLSLIALLILSTFLINCGGGSGGSSSPGGEKPGVPEIVQVLPSHYIAMTNSAILIRAKILNGNGGPVKNLPVTFTNISPIGTLMNSNDAALGNKTVVRTNDSGMATIKVKSTTSGFVTIQAEVNKGVGIVRDRKTMYFGSSLSLSPFMYLDVNGDGDTVYNEPTDYTLFENDNDNKVVVRATVFSKFGQRVSGVSVQFGADSTEATFPNGNTATTNSDGEAFTLVQVDPAAIRDLETFINITASASNGAANIYTLYLLPVTISSVTVNANPSVLAPNATSAISAAVKLNTGGPPPDSSAVGFVADCGTVTPFALTTSGLATATFTAPSTVPAPPLCIVTARIAGQEGHTIPGITISSALNVQPGTQTLNGLSGGTVSYIISGGVAPYTVTSSDRFSACNSTDPDCSDAEDSGTWTVSASGGIFTVTVPVNTAAKSITLSVRDLVGTTASATLTIGSGGALSVQPGTVTVNGDTPPAAGVTFTIFGGVPPYDVFPNNADIAFTPLPSSHVTSSGGTFKVTVPPGTTAQTIIYTVRDSAGTTTTGTLTITSTALAGLIIIPGSASVIGAAPADIVTFTVSGGTAPYIITSSDPASTYDLAVGDGIWNVATSGGTFDVHVPVNAATGDVTLNVFDTAGATKSATLSIIAGSAATGLQLNPATVSVTGVSTAADAVPFVITGGTGPYTMLSSNAAVIPSVAVAGSTFTINPNVVGENTAVTITVIDTVTGLTDTAVVTVTPATSTMALNPSTISVSPGTNNMIFNIIGGVSSFTVYSSNTSVVTLDGATIGGPNTVAGNSFTADAVGAGTSTITVVDSDGNTKTATVTVTASGGAGTILVLPGSVTVIGAAPADTVTFTVSGGTPPYVVTSTDPSSACNSITSADNDCVDATDTGIWSVLLSGGTFPVTVPVNAATGNITLNIFDSLGNTGNATLAIIQGATPTGMTLNPASISVTGLSGSGDNVTFTITGGTSPYTAFSSNTAIAPVVTPPGLGNTFTVGPEVVFGSTGVTLTAVDSLGLTKTATITVTPVSSSLGVNPSTIATVVGQTIQFQIIGGVSTYDVYTSDDTIVTVGGGAKINNLAGTAFNAQAIAAGQATITIVDSDGKTITATVTIN
jgi:hypothetical protein